jgi:vancomycin resistance protein YoaR
LTDAFQEVNIDTDTISDIIDYKVLNNTELHWYIHNKELLSSTLTKYASTSDKQLDEGEYLYKNDTILLLKQPSEGKTILIDSTITEIEQWLNSPTDKLPIIYDRQIPKILSSTNDIIDFTKILGIGKTRLALQRYGKDNLAILTSEGPLKEINYNTVQPNEEFSFIQAIGREGNYTKSGYFVGEGSCNATTTLFRAVLESGLPITERHAHGYFVQSYIWGGYPYNIVDASYYPNPAIDFKFVNDYKLPILILVKFDKDSTYKYHTIEIRTGANVSERDVRITNWKIWNKVGQYNFYGSFDRIIKKNGKTITETFLTPNVGTPYLFE